MTERVAALDIGSSKLAAGLFDERLNLTQHVTRDLRGLPYPQILEVACETASGLVREHPDIVAVGVAAAGDVDPAAGTVAYMEAKVDNPHSVRGRRTSYPVGDMLHERLDLPVAVDHDSAAAVIAEWRAGAGTGYDDLVGITVGTYVVTGVVARGEVMRHRTGSPHIGATLMPYGDGYEHIGMLAGGMGIAMLAREHLANHGTASFARLAAENKLGGEEIHRLAEQGDPDAHEVLRQSGRWLGVVATSAANTFNPDVIVLGGGVMRAQEYLMPSFHEVFTNRKWRESNTEGVRVVMGQFGARAALAGAAVNAFQKVGG